MRRQIAILILVSMHRIFSAEPAEIETTVNVVKPVHRDVTRWVKLPATIEPDAEITLYAKVSGFLQDFSIDVGDRVKAGQVVGRLDAPELEQDIKAAEALLAATEADYRRTVAEYEHEKGRDKEIDAEETITGADILKSKADRSRVKDQCDRTERLFAKSAATEEEREAQKFLCMAADATVKSMELKLKKFAADRALWASQVAVAKSAMDAAQGKVAVARTAVDKAKLWFSFTEIRIPQVGSRPGAQPIVTKRFVANGDLVPGGAVSRSGIQPIVTLQVSDPVRLIADVPEGDSQGITTGTPVRISFPHSTQEPALFKISRTSNTLSANSRTLRIEIDIPNADGKLRTGMSAHLEIAAEMHKGVLAVPAGCIIADRRESSVLTVEDGKVKKVTVEVGLHGQKWYEISAPSVSENSLVIQDAVEGIVDGTPVKVKSN